MPNKENLKKFARGTTPYSFQRNIASKVTTTNSWEAVLPIRDRKTLKPLKKEIPPLDGPGPQLDELQRCSGNFVHPPVGQNESPEEPEGIFLLKPGKG